MSSPFTVRSLQTAKPGRHRIDPNLYLEVSKDGRSRRFLLRFTSPVTLRPTEAGLGTYPTVSLADARARASEMRAAIAKGIDPIVTKREARASILAAQEAAKTFDDALVAYAKAFVDKGAVTIELEALLRRHVAQLLLRPLKSISSNEVLEALAPLSSRLPKTAARARAAIAIVFDYALARNMFNGSNPASRTVFKFLLPSPPRSEHHRSMDYRDIPAFWQRLREKGSVTSLALQFLILAALRTQECLRLTLDEIDLDQRLVAIPAQRMKMRRPHVVPISDAMRDVLDEARDMFASERLVFPGLAKGSPLNSRALESLMHQQLREPYAVHGFRASFSTWAHERTDVPHELIEMSLAHIEGQGNAVARAYNRSDAIERRRALMQVWGDFVTGAQVSNVVPFAVTARP
jgi:integrase